MSEQTYWISMLADGKPCLMYARSRGMAMVRYSDQDGSGTEYWRMAQDMNGSHLVVSIQNNEVKRFDLPKLPTVAEARALLEGE